jgi:hypothetical protein
MKGIADGAAAAGAKFDGRAIDLTDIVGLNCWAEIETLDSALDATPTGLEGVRFKHAHPEGPAAVRPMHCSAFAATGAATADGKVVFGHVTMFDLYPSLFYNVWLDVQPAKGHRVLMQSYPGGIQSGMDYYQNDAGLLVSETTITQTRFDPKGLSLASRIRKALQYADSIDQAVEILQKDNNGLYTNEWLLADTKTNEIAMFELGTAKSKLYRSSKGEWFGGTEGFYWGCNNTKDLEVRLETIPSVDGKPANLVWHPSDRDRKWLQLYGKSKGKIDAAFAREAFTTPPLCSSSTIDAKFTTTDLAKDLKSWGLFGPPRGRSWKPTDEEKQNYPEVRALAANPWTLLSTQAPPKEKEELAGLTIVDLPEKVEAVEADKDDDKPSTMLRSSEKAHDGSLWRGTLLPKTDGDAWLAAAFAEYETVVAHEKKRKDTPADREENALDLLGHRTRYLAAAGAGTEQPLLKTRSSFTDDGWYHTASGKGCLLLHELRRLAGKEKFASLMDSFGRKHAGQAVTTAEFQAHFEKELGKPAENFFAWWLNEIGLPELKLEKVATPEKRTVTGTVRCGVPGALAAVDVTVETDEGEQTESVPLENGVGTFRIKVASGELRRVVVDKYGCSKSNGSAFVVNSFEHDLEDTLIVYGTGDEAAANREAAEALQAGIREHWFNGTVPIVADHAVTDDDLKGHHLLLIGRPDSNAIVERFRTALPVAFGKRSFVVRQDVYAHAGSALLASATNPLNRKYSVTVVAGLSAASTLRLTSRVMKKDDLPTAEVVVVPNGGSLKGVVIPAKELVFDLSK